MGREERILVGTSAMLAAIAAVLLGTLSRGLGAAALAMLCASLVMSPLARVSPAAWAVAARSARRRAGIAAAVLAIVHALVALPRYLTPIAWGPIVTLPWLRHGALALAILVPMLVTSFPAMHRLLRVRAWSALHRLGYGAALLGALHALAVPFGSVRVGLVALGLVLIALLARPLVALASRVRRQDDEL